MYNAEGIDEATVTSASESTLSRGDVRGTVWCGDRTATAGPANDAWHATHDGEPSGD